tara:strand:- start:2911 stop:3303 length:393 start_codon:yes stop_codon:yes gene_type:complete
MIMGLDMYLTGDKFVPEHQDNLPRAKVDSYPVESQRLKLGYWRKHWALHNYINDNYGDGYKIELNSDNLREISEAVEHGHLLDANYRDEIDAYHKEPEQVAKTAKILADAADWLDKEDNTWKSVEYYGSW